MNELHERLRRSPGPCWSGGDAGGMARGRIDARAGNAAAGIGRALGCAETVELTLEAAAAGNREVLSVNLVTDFLERVEGLVGRRAAGRPPPAGRPVSQEVADGRTSGAMFAWPNARVRLRGPCR